MNRDDLRPVVFTELTFEILDGKLVNTETNPTEGFFHAWLIQSGIAKAIIEKKDGQIVHVDSERIKFVQSHKLDF